MGFSHFFKIKNSNDHALIVRIMHRLMQKKEHSFGGEKFFPIIFSLHLNTYFCE